MFGRLLAAVIVLATALICLAIGWPQLFGVEQGDWVSRIVALRAVCALVGLGLLVVCVLFAAVARRARGFFGALGLVLAAFIALEAVVLGSRGLLPTAMAEADGDTISVLSWNTLGDAVDADELAELVRQTGADAVALPETTSDYAARLRDLLESDGEGWQAFTFSYDKISPARSTSLLVSDRLGEYRAETSTPTTAQLPTLVARPVGGAGPVIAAVHAVAPIEGEMNDWRSGLRWLAELCAERPEGGLLLAGDFNSTIDHWSHLTDGSVPKARLGACLDAAEATGQGGQGTWPTSVPSLIGAPIDHVLHSADWAVAGFRVIGSKDEAGSDHRPILARLKPVSAGE